MWLQFCCILTVFRMASSVLPDSKQPVIVVGGGLAGLSAALEIVRNGGKVIVIESQKDVGGNSAKASSGINGVGTEAQRLLKIADSEDLFFSDTLTAGDRENDASLVDRLIHESKAAIQFLIDLGVNLMDVNLCGGHSVPRTHWVPSAKEGKPSPIGIAIIRAIKQKLLEWQEKHPESVQILTETTVFGLVTWNDYVTGVRVHAMNKAGNRREISGKAVVLTTGGYSNDHESDTLLGEFTPNLLKFPTTNGAFATGSGIKMARAMGAKLIDMEYVQIHPTAFIDPSNPEDRTKFLAAEALRGKGALLLNGRGERFADELGRRDYLTRRILDDCPIDDEAKVKVARLILNDAAVTAFGWPAFNFYWKIKKFFTKVENVGELAKLVSVESKTIEKTLADYNAAADTKNPDVFGKKVLPIKFDPTQAFYVAKITPAMHYSMGGLKISKETEVLGEDGKWLQGLYAAGEVTGGVHGKNRLAGNSLLECVVFGRNAGIKAAKLTYSREEL